MIRKILFSVAGGILLMLLGAAAGLWIGSFLGGNFFTTFEFAGNRGHEAAGVLGLMILAPLGLISGILLGLKISRQ